MCLSDGGKSGSTFDKYLPYSLSLRLRTKLLQLLCILVLDAESEYVNANISSHAELTMSLGLRTVLHAFPPSRSPT